MPLNPVTIPIQVTSNVGAAVNSAWVHVGQQSFDVQFHGPAALHVVQVSSDKQDADVATDADGAAITAVAAAYREVRERPNWARIQILTDAGGPRIFAAELLLKREDF
jgi:hypothetical protein